jgi:dihydroflavonol-4-reductase
MKALVLGAGGFLGLNLVAALKAHGVAPRCGRRARGNVLGLRRLNAELVLTELDAPDTLAEAMRGTDVVFHLAGHYPRLSLDPHGTVRTAQRQMAAVLDAAAQSGVQRLVYVSSTATVAAAPNRLSAERDVFAHAPDAGAYHLAKWHMEQLVDAERRYQTVTVCPGACLGAHDWKVGTAALLVAAARGECPPHPDGWVNPVDASDVAELLVRLAGSPRPPRRVLACGGSYRLHDVLRGVSQRYGPAVLPAPLPAHEAMAFAEAEERRAQREGGRPRLSQEIAALVVHGVPIDASLGKQALGRGWTPLDSTLDTFDAWARGMGLFAHPPQRSTA